MSHRINEMGLNASVPTHLNASLSLSWWNVECVGLANIDFDSMRWWTGNGVCVLALGVPVGNEVTCDVDAHDEFGVTELLWLTAVSVEFNDVTGVGGDASDSEHPCDFFVLEFGVDFVDGFPVLEMSLAFECSSSRSLPPLSSFNASAASNDLRCMPVFIKRKWIGSIKIGLHLAFKLILLIFKWKN